VEHAFPCYDMFLVSSRELKIQAGYLVLRVIITSNGLRNKCERKNSEPHKNWIAVRIVTSWMSKIVNETVACPWSVFVGRIDGQHDKEQGQVLRLY
jgi:hypothetical protein